MIPVYIPDITMLTQHEDVISLVASVHKPYKESTFFVGTDTSKSVLEVCKKVKLKLVCSATGTSQNIEILHVTRLANTLS